MPLPFLKKREYGRVDEKPRRRLLNKKTLKILILSVVSAGLLGFVALTVIAAVITRDLPDPGKLSERPVAESTKIYDRTGQHLLYEIYEGQKRTMVELNQIADFAKKAVIAIEDKRFYEHKGVRWISILRAGFNNLIGRRTGGGGASTLTQQFVKKVVVGDKRTIFRKIKEAVMAIRLEKKYTKDQILKLYLNEIPYGSTNYGIEAASQSYFRKSAKDLDLAESAALAAILPAPSRYLNDLNALRSRRDIVLKLMQEQGYINEEQMEEAQNKALRLYRSAGILNAPHFVLYVKQLLADQYGEKKLDTGGFKVITSLDFAKQTLAEKIIKEQGDKFASSSNANNASLVAIDPKTGQILAMVGSRDFNNEAIDGQFNVAVLGKLQPGSSFKPFVYTAAFEKGYTSDTVLYDVSTNFDRRVGGKYQPKNYDGKERGLVTMRKALQGSLNIPAVKTLYLAGINYTLDFAKRFGYTTLSEKAGLSLVLGGSEVNLLEHANAYATLANSGVYHKPVSVLKITDQTGGAVYEWQASEGDEAISPELAAKISNVLSDNVSRAYMFGTKNNLVLPGRPVAAKTGTTQNSWDAWTMGYTPSLAAGVWVGNTPKHLPMKAGGNTLAGSIWNKFMSEALQGAAVEFFPSPPASTATKPILRGGESGITLAINSATGRIAISTTPPDLIVNRTYLPPHDILHYVVKDDPNGPGPLNPYDDPQYENWETALTDWIGRQQKAGRELTLAEPPSEYDTPGDPALSPVVQIITPATSSTLTSRQIDIQVSASAPRGVSLVTYKIDGIKIGSASQPPFNYSWYAKNLAMGPHTLEVTAQDDQNNWTVAAADFDLQADFDPPSFEWFDASPLALKAEDWPRVMLLDPFRWNETKEIKIYLVPANGVTKLIYTFNHDDTLFNGKLSLTWKTYPGAGQYDLKGVLTDSAGRAAERVLRVVTE
ncbi:PBP1A family penicillin-binding protein [Patescibacteria group bacterium]|nr:MAG: PBP1A family penicillin-binding protein [Patescibacteria group bacterium]